MNKMPQDLHVLVFLKKLQLKVRDILVLTSRNVEKGSLWKGYDQVDFSPLIRWIEEYPDLGMPELIEAKNEELLLFRPMVNKFKTRQESFIS